MTIDVVIIGSGPAGTMCGIELQRSGRTTCIIEREKLPRQKLCGVPHAEDRRPDSFEMSRNRDV